MSTLKPLKFLDLMVKESKSQACIAILAMIIPWSGMKIATHRIGELERDHDHQLSKSISVRKLLFYLKSCFCLAVRYFQLWSGGG